MIHFDIYSSDFNITEGNALNISNDDYNGFKEDMDRLNSDCAINDAKSWKAASEIILTD